jgi:HlyD family type I secretion membrane fusion protein
MSTDSEITRSLRRNVLAVIAIVIGLIGIIFGWAALTDIGGAVIASGDIAVESDVKRIQHREGGIVTAILVKEGDEVAAGDLLFRLDDTVERANLLINERQLSEMLIQEARLIAESQGAGSFTLPAMFGEGSPDVPSILEGQRSLMAARAASLEGQNDQLRQQIGQLSRRIDGLESQEAAKATEIGLVVEELATLQGLLDKELVQKSRVTALKREQARLAGERGGYIADIARTGQEISEIEIKILQLGEEFKAGLFSHLQETRAKIATLTEQKVAVSDQLRRTEIRALQAGLVHQLTVHTVGGVIGAGVDLMQIVPDKDVLIIDARVSPTDIDQVLPGQEAIVHLNALNQRLTPKLTGRVLTISPELVRDPRSDADYYRVQLGINEEELAQLKDVKLLPGMPVQAFLQTGERSALSYLIKPVSDQISNAFREE